MTSPRAATHTSLSLVGDELRSVIDLLASGEDDALDEFADAVAGASRVFLMGAGRSGIALRMTAMRLMHLGLVVHVVGETTTPAIGAGDLLIAASGSGTTGSVVRAATTAHAVGATVCAITTASDSPLVTVARVVVQVPAAAKLDRSGQASAQYAGSLFEQAVVVIGDALFDALWRAGQQSADELWPRHANLE